MQLGKMGKAVQSVGQMSMNNAAFSTLAHMPLPSSNPIHQKGRATKLTMELSWAPFLGRNVSEKARCGSNFSTGNSGPIQDSQKQESYGLVSQKTKQRLGGYGLLHDLSQISSRRRGVYTSTPQRKLCFCSSNLDQLLMKFRTTLCYSSSKN